MSLEAVYCYVEVVKTAHGMYCLHYHVVWVCKYRRKILSLASVRISARRFPGCFAECPGSRSSQLALTEIMFI